MTMSREPDRSLRPHRRPLGLLPLVALSVALLATTAACRPSPEQVAVGEEEIRGTIDRYTTLLSQAYAFADASLLDPVASQREVAAVHANVQQLASQGQRIATDLKEMQIEEIGMSDVNNAYVQTFEVWEIRVMDLGSERVISIDRNQRNRVRYQLKKGEGRWEVLWRQRLDEGRSSGGGAGGGDAPGVAPEGGPPAGDDAPGTR